MLSERVGAKASRCLHELWAKETSTSLVLCPQHLNGLIGTFPNPSGTDQPCSPSTNHRPLDGPFLEGPFSTMAGFPKTAH